MQPTQRTGTAAVLAGGLAILAVLFARPLFLVGTVFIGAWALGRQYHLHRVSLAVTDTISVAQAPAQDVVRIEDQTQMSLSASIPGPAALPLHLAAGLPRTSRRTDPLTIALPRGMTAAERTEPITWPVVGRHRFSPATLTVRDPLVTQSIPIGPTPTVTVTARGPRNVHLGAGGDEIAIGYGEHKVGRIGPGIEPAELREYLPGDDARRIDWNATARLTDVYVREFEAETDRRTLFLLDSRSSLHAGLPAETKLDYLRTIGLALAETTSARNDPLGFIAIDENGISNRIQPGTSVATYRAVREALLEFEHEYDLHTRSRHHRTTTEVRRTAKALETDDSSFASTLRPFFRTHERIPITTAPLANAVRTTLRQDPAITLTVILTDDANRAELRDAVKLASRPGHATFVLMTPTALFRDTDPETAYTAYADFESFRRQLDALPRVRAFEVGPRDTLATVLANGRAHTRRQYA